MPTIPLSPAGRGEALVDAEDFETLGSHTWWLKQSLRIKARYAYTVIDGHVVMMHRLLLPDVAAIDHVNGDGLDNRRENLRPATRSQNQWNGRKRIARSGRPASSRYKGVWFDARRSRWCANLHHGGRTVHLGRFTDEESAARAYDEGAQRLFGDFARLNFP